MIFAIVLAITWLIVLIRYPRHALPILLVAMMSIGLLITGVLWHDSREQKRLDALDISLSYDPTHCPLNESLRLQLTNTSNRSLTALRFKVTAFAPTVSANLMQSGYAQYHVPLQHALAPGLNVSFCLALPALRSGYRASTVQFMAIERQGAFD